MRLLSCIVFLLAQPLVCHAAITPEELRQMAYDGDIEGAEMALREAHQETIDGTLAYNDLREIANILVVTHPDVIDFVNDWRAAYPDSPYANAVWVFQTQKASWAIRTNNVVSKVHPQAMQTFNRMQRQAMEVALKAYAAAPDYVLASDAVLTHNLTTKMLSPSEHLQVLTDVMRVTPSRDSLARGSLLTQPDWGGPGYGAIVRLCNMFAGKITDIPDYTPDVCTIDLIYHYPSIRDDGRRFAYELMEEFDHPQLAKARAWRSLDQGLEGERSAVISYLSDPDVFNDWMYRRFMWLHAPNYEWEGADDDEIAEFVALYESQLADFVNEGLQHDPYDPDVISRGYKIYESHPYNPVTSNYDYDADSARIDYLLRRRNVVASPFAGHAWHNLANIIEQEHQPPLDLDETTFAYDPIFINAIYFSDHDTASVANLLQNKVNKYRHLRSLEESGVANPLTKEEELARLTCPIVRLNRLFDAICAVGDDCADYWQFARDHAAEIATDVAKRGLCHAERNGSLQSLLYTEAVPFDLGDLNEGIANR